jgi:ribosomal protein S18 acetylase RimI-like enzyme
MPIIYREEVKPADCDVVRQIVASSGFFSAGEIEVAVELVEERLHKGAKSGYFFIFAEESEVVVGYSCFGPIACTNSSFDLYWIAVDDRYRRLGIGKELLYHTESRIAEAGGDRIYVETSSRAQYEATRLFYEKSGYRKEASLKDFYAPGDDKVIYVKTLRRSISTPR